MRGKFLLTILPMTFLSAPSIANTERYKDFLSFGSGTTLKANAESIASIAVGSGASVSKLDANDSNLSVAVGTYSSIKGSLESTVVGSNSKILSSKNSTILGGNSEIKSSNFGVAIGNNSNINNAEYGVAIGNSAKVTNKNSVSLGSNSITDRDNSISVGNNSLKRQITFVADGLKGSDAATVNQVDKSAKATLKSANNYTDGLSKKTLSDAKDYTNKSAEATLKSANNYTDGLSKKTLSDANIYTDSKISSSGNKLYQDLRQYTDQKADQLNNRINQVNKRIDKGLASSAALTGLFQPYGVGKVNFTAGIGGYRSTQALAIGSGYRVNENTAIKAGMALSDSKNIMYNASFNLEW